ncbi:hypothetical protein HDU91_004797 [Kappamyces sp. JEL0680]|nr:hypothetical protein HDU91_004797 [Kappamyces sp. JEL0680]
MPQLNVGLPDQAPINLHYTLHGTGPCKILLVAGLGCLAGERHFQTQFFQSLPQYSVCTFDNRGSGKSDCTPEPFRTTLLAQDAACLLAHLGWTEPVHIVGFSMGGMIAQELAYLLGETRVASLALVSTFAYFNGLPAVDQLDYAQLLSWIQPAPCHSLQSYLDERIRFNFPRTWLRQQCTRPGCERRTNYQIVFELEHRLFSEFGLPSPLAKANQTRACITHYFSSRLHDLAAHAYPKLVVTGDQDDCIRQPMSSLYLAKHLQADLHVYPGGGHAIHLQDPDWLNALLHSLFQQTLETAKGFGLKHEESFDAFLVGRSLDSLAQ